MDTHELQNRIDELECELAEVKELLRVEKRLTEDFEGFIKGMAKNMRRYLHDPTKPKTTITDGTTQ